jgi:hypothetical protein
MRGSGGGDMELIRCTCSRDSPNASASSLSHHHASRHHNHGSEEMLPDEIIAQLNSEFQCRDLQIQHLAALYAVCLSPCHAAFSNTHRRISHPLHCSTSTASPPPGNPQYCAPSSTYQAFRTLSSMCANASPRDTSWSAWSHRRSMRSNNTTTRRWIDDHMRAPKTSARYA